MKNWKHWVFTVSGTVALAFILVHGQTLGTAQPQTVGALTATTVNGNTITTGTGTLTIAAGKTLTANNTITLQGTDSTTFTLPATTSSLAPTFPSAIQSSASVGGSPVTLTAAQCGGAFALDAATGVVYILPSTLPAVGCTYDFYATVSVTSNSHEIESGNAAHFLTGAPLMAVAAGGNAASFVCNGTSHIAYKSNGTTTGGLAGSHYRATVMSATLIWLDGLNNGSGSLATACNTSN